MPRGLDPWNSLVLSLPSWEPQDIQPPQNTVMTELSPKLATSSSRQLWPQLKRKVATLSNIQRTQSASRPRESTPGQRGQLVSWLHEPPPPQWLRPGLRQRWYRKHFWDHWAGPEPPSGCISMVSPRVSMACPNPTPILQPLLLRYQPPVAGKKCQCSACSLPPTLKQPPLIRTWPQW